MRNHNFFNKNTSNVKCHTGNYGNVNLHFFFHCKLYNELFFFTFNMVYFQTGILYQLFTVYST